MQWACTELDHSKRLVLADALGDTPETVSTIHKLRRGLCRAFVLGSPEEPTAAVIQPTYLQTEPIGFGNNPERLWAVLRDLDGWESVNVSLDLSPALAEIIERETGWSCWLCEEIYYVHGGDLPTLENPAVRRLAPDDMPLMEAATDALGMAGWRYGSASALIEHGFAAGAILENRLVSVAFTSGQSDRHTEIGVVTEEAWRGRGYSTAAAALVCEDILRSGHIPVWSTAEDNLASRRVAAKLGFVEVARRVYVNLGE